jgi:RimJ/RimL family protein N-acetyltransferase
VAGRASGIAGIGVLLRPVIPTDLPIFFEHQRDPVANQMAAFSARDRASFMAHWERILADDTVITRTVEVDRAVAGNVVSFERSGRREVGYWIGRSYWGRGIATRALSVFLAEVPLRPLHAHVAKANVGSLRVLEKCGFAKSGEVTTSDEHADEVEELVLILAD